MGTEGLHRNTVLEHTGTIIVRSSIRTNVNLAPGVDMNINAIIVTVLGMACLTVQGKIVTEKENRIDMTSLKRIGMVAVGTNSIKYVLNMYQLILTFTYVYFIL